MQVAVLTFLGNIFARSQNGAAASLDAEAQPVNEIVVDGAPIFPLSGHLSLHEGYPILDWGAVYEWAVTVQPDSRHSQVWTEVEKAWLLHMRMALGPQFRLRQTNAAFLLSSLEGHVATATLTYMERTLNRVVALLDGKRSIDHALALGCPLRQ